MGRKGISLDELRQQRGFKSPEDSPPKKKLQQQRNFQSQRNSQPQQNPARQATAPYNFVSLPEKVLPAQFNGVDGFKEHLGSAGNISGEILLDISTLTPLFIGGNGSKSFAPVNKPIIPGSSLRGMFKNIFKIVTCGAFRGQTTSQGKGEDFNDEHIYFRALMGVGRYPWTKDLNKLYNSRMTHSAKGKDGKLHPVKNARPGFLICTTDNKYFIAPSIYKSDRKEDRILIREYEEKFHARIDERNSSCVEWHDGTAYIITGSQARFKLHDAESYKKLKGDDKKKAGKQFIRFTKLDYVDWSRDHWIDLPEEVRTSYEHDRNRRGVDLFTDKSIMKRAELERLTKKSLPDIKSLIPCHFLEERGQVTAFGHGQCFRIPYQKRIGDAAKISDNNATDFADAVFGCTELWASRVYFEDAVPVDGKVSELAAAKAHPLMQPNPTSYQLYLKQDGDTLNHWDAVAAQIRGYKLYWHNDTDDWKANAFELGENQKRVDGVKEPLTKDITPLDRGNKFRAKIRFKNLSAVELGALMTMFDLYGSTDAAYKIGMGKPFGFGSVRIKPTLLVENDDAYSELFGADGWQNPCCEKNPAEYLDAFKDYLRSCDMYETWRQVMVELKKILDWSLTKRERWSKKIATMRGSVKIRDGKQTMELDERFRQRDPLPTIFDVVK